MTASQQIREKISEMPRGKPISLSSIRQLGTSDNIRQVMLRMVKTGDLERIARGIYIRPMNSRYVQSVSPSAKEVAEEITKNTGELISIHGAEAARRLKLTTQVPTQPIFYTTGNNRKIKFGKMTITLKHITPRKLVAPGTIVGTVITALWYLGKKNVTNKIIKKIVTQLTEEQLNDLMNEIEHMPHWMADLFYNLKQDKEKKID